MQLLKTGRRYVQVYAISWVEAIGRVKAEAGIIDKRNKNVVVKAVASYNLNDTDDMNRFKYMVSQMSRGEAVLDVNGVRDTCYTQKKLSSRVYNLYRYGTNIDTGNKVFQFTEFDNYGDLKQLSNRLQVLIKYEEKDKMLNKNKICS